MYMNYGGFVPVSTVDWFGSSVAVVFFRGCSLVCKDCLNKSIMCGENLVDIEEIKQKIIESKPIISGVVFTGGEPCEQIDVLMHLVHWSKAQGLKVYLHTSGNKPEELSRIVQVFDGIRLDHKPKEQLPSENNERWKAYWRNFVWSQFVINSAYVPFVISMVALRGSNESLPKEYRNVTSKTKDLIIVQGIEEDPFTPEELSKAYVDCYIYTKQNGLQWVQKS